MNHPDQKYIDALLTNDCVLLRELYARFSGTIKKMVLNNNGSLQDAADIFQEGLMALYVMAKDRDFLLSGPLEPYLYSICKNKWLKKIEKNNVLEVTKYSEQGNKEFKVAMSENDESVHRERKKFVYKKLGELGNICRQLIILNITGIPLYEVADILDISYAYVRRKKGECISLLVKMIKQSPEYEQLKW